jgi:formyltetrahydrofolate deformylase
METAILLFQSLDQQGIIASVTNFLLKHSANIISLDQYSTDQESGTFFLRLVFSYHENKTALLSIEKQFDEIGSPFNAQWRFFAMQTKMKMGILVSKPDHCLVELLYRWKSREINLEIPFIASNHPDHKNLAKLYDIPFYHLEVEKEEKILEISKKHCDFIVLARYMQILSGHFLTQFSKDIINIHHSFLPSFAGAKPYHQAHKKGVKLIGATAHFVTEELDEGPIIEQMVARVTHKDDVHSLIEKGRSLEKLTLSQAVINYVEHRVIRHGKRTIVFS